MKRYLSFITVALSIMSASVYGGKKNNDEALFFASPIKKIHHLHASNAMVSSYLCKEDSELQVQYFSVAETPAALIPVEGKKLLFVKVLSASGEKYVSGPYIWWTKGEKAFLENSQSPRPHKLVYSDCEQRF